MGSVASLCYHMQIHFGKYIFIIIVNSLWRITFILYSFSYIAGVQCFTNIATSHCLLLYCLWTAAFGSNQLEIIRLSTYSLHIEMARFFSDPNQAIAADHSRQQKNVLHFKTEKLALIHIRCQISLLQFVKSTFFHRKSTEF